MRLPGSILQGILARAALVLLRIYLGVIFLVAAWPKLRGDSAPRLVGFLEKVALLPNASLVASLVAWGELLVGLTLILGLLTRMSATVALLLVLNSMFAKGASFWQPSSGNEGAFAVIAVALSVPVMVAVPVVVEVSVAV